MKGSERHRLKENELSHVLGDATARLQENRSTFGLAAGIVALLLVAGVGYWAWTTRKRKPRAGPARRRYRHHAGAGGGAEARQRSRGATGYPTVQARAEAALAKFAEVYNAYPSTDAGIASRYYAASALAMLGRHEEAADAFSGNRRSRRGEQRSTAAWRGSASSRPTPRRRNTTRRSAAAQALVNNTSDDTIPRDALLMELGRVQAAAGKKAEAKQTLDKVIAEFPESPYIEEAKRMLTELT